MKHRIIAFTRFHPDQVAQECNDWFDAHEHCAITGHTSVYSLGNGYTLFVEYDEYDDVPLWGDPIATQATVEAWR